MGLILQLLNVERKFPWTLFGFLLGIGGIIFAVYTYHLSKEEQKADLRVTINDEVNLVEVKERIPLLKIFYASQDIIETKKEIKLLTVTLANSGQSIRQDDYDENKDFGLIFENAQILGVNITDSNSGYLREIIGEVSSTVNQLEGSKSSTSSRNILNFKKILIDKGSFIKFKVFLLGESGTQKTSITPLGKISGMDLIPVIYNGTKENKPSEEKVAIPAMLIIATVTYFFIALSPIFYVKVNDRIEASQRKSAVEHFIAENESLTEEQINILEREVDPKGWTGLGLN